MNQQMETAPLSLCLSNKEIFTKKIITINERKHYSRIALRKPLRQFWAALLAARTGAWLICRSVFSFTLSTALLAEMGTMLAVYETPTVHQTLVPSTSQSPFQFLSVPPLFQVFQ